ncbi:serine/threonine-protein phosphatase 2A activator 2 [Polyplosphaeria fusca]|uniref:Serine/threonine-protein phosphatase 2A activator n=1 Tax=Polyplosphaeria fusca TaxID=682080 RepID=A0A9P4V542_9PLEO|nr:serine/threonine-protein phosphatase 2A activator 2 [Polyplosphaeria fusca]
MTNSAISAPPAPDLSTKLPKLVPRRRAEKKAGTDATPAPPTPPLSAPPDLTGHAYKRPERRILSREDHELFLKSPTCELVTAWIFTLSDSVKDRAVSSIKDDEITDTVKKVLWILEQAGKVLARCPPEDTGSRFGNPVFRTFIDEISDSTAAWHEALGLDDAAQIEEVGSYLRNAFGNKRRIDYGSGHELNFFLWLLCLRQVGLLPSQTFPALVLVVLPAYLRLMRAVQEAYYLEPAGSHGVWGLDDYQFLPFLFGAAQLVGHAYITPKSIHSAITLEEFGNDYLYLDQVAFVNSVKNVEGLRWHSPMLDDISASRGWGKIEGGMRKMFVAEILSKLPVMQHFLFGSLIPAEEGMATEDQYGLGREEEEDEGGEVKVWTDEEGKRHVHANAGWGDCCGIRVPAAVGAEGEERKNGAGARLRRVPFD